MYIDYKKLKEKSIDLNQYPVLENIDKMISLKLEEIELYKKLKQSLFIHKLTDEKVVYLLQSDKGALFFSEIEGRKLIDRNFHDLQIIDIAKLRLKDIG